MIRSVIAIAFIFISTFTFSQTNDTDHSGVKDSRYQITGYHFNSYSSSLDKFQSVLKSNDFARLEDLGFSFELFFKTKRINSRWDGSMSFGIHERGTSNKYAKNQASLRGYSIGLERGYDLIKGNKFVLRPFAGVGFEYYKMSFAENIGIGSLSNITNSDFKSYSANSFRLPLTLGLEVGTSFRIKSRRIALSLRGGYKLHPNLPWKIDDTFELQDKVNLSSPFVGLSIGFSLFDHDE